MINKLGINLEKCWKNLRDGTYHTVLQVPLDTNKCISTHRKQICIRSTHRHLSEISPENTCNIMCCVILLLPIQRLSVLHLYSEPSMKWQALLLCMLTRGSVSNWACSSRIRLFEPFTRNVPSTSVAGLRVSGVANFVNGMTYHTPLSIGHYENISKKSILDTR